MEGEIWEHSFRLIAKGFIHCSRTCQTARFQDSCQKSELDCIQMFSSPRELTASLSNPDASPSSGKGEMQDRIHIPFGVRDSIFPVNFPFRTPCFPGGSSCCLCCCCFQQGWSQFCCCHCGRAVGWRTAAVVTTATPSCPRAICINAVCAEIRPFSFPTQTKL